MRTTRIMNDLSKRMSGLISEKKWSKLNMFLELIAEEASDAIFHNRTKDLAKIFPTLKLGLDRVVSENPEVVAEENAATTAAQIRGTMRLLAAMSRREKRETLADVLEVQNLRKIIEALQSASLGLSGRELSDRTSIDPAAISRSMARLRAAGIVTSPRVGKDKRHKLTDDAARQLKHRDVANQFRRIMTDDAWVQRVVTNDCWVNDISDSLLISTFNKPKTCFNAGRPSGKAVEIANMVRDNPPIARKGKWIAIEDRPQEWEKIGLEVKNEVDDLVLLFKAPKEASRSFKSR